MDGNPLFQRRFSYFDGLEGLCESFFLRKRAAFPESAMREPAFILAYSSSNI
jgi:hypothetical protein